MKPIIRKKGKDTQGNARYVIQKLVDGKLEVISLNPTKIWTILKSTKITKENE